MVHFYLEDDDSGISNCFFFCYWWRKKRQEDNWAVWAEDSEGEYCIRCDDADCTCRIYFEDEFREKFGE